MLLVLFVLLRLEQSWCGILQRGFDPRAVRLLLLRGDLDLSLLLSLLALGPRLILAFPLGPPLAVPLPVAMIPVAVEPIHVRPAAHPVSVPPVPSIPPRAMVPVPVPVPVPVVITVPAAFAAGVPGPARVPVVPAPIARIIPAPLAVPVVVTRAVPILALGLGYRVDLTLLVGARVGWSHLTSPARLCLDREWSAQIIRPHHQVKHACDHAESSHLGDSHAQALKSQDGRTPFPSLRRQRPVRCHGGASARHVQRGRARARLQVRTRPPPSRRFEI